MKLLVSVRDAGEARLAAESGVDFIDGKDPATGALGGLPPDRLRELARALQGVGFAGEFSATIGDLGMADAAAIRQRVLETAACGVDIVKVGLLPEGGAEAVVADLAGLPLGPVRVVPVLIADQPLDPALLAAVLAARAPGGGPAFPAVMVDTAAKTGGSLLHRRGADELAGFIAQVRTAGRLAGLAGALRQDEWPALAALSPDFAGFRSAVCSGDRAGAMDPLRLDRLLRLARGSAPRRPVPTAQPSVK